MPKDACSIMPWVYNSRRMPLPSHYPLLALTLKDPPRVGLYFESPSETRNFCLLQRKYVKVAQHIFLNISKSNVKNIFPNTK